jgi:hypothetical protein
MDKLNCGQGIGSEWKCHGDGLMQHFGSRGISQIWRFGDMSMKFQASNDSKSLLINCVYLALTFNKLFLSNPDWKSAGWYFPLRCHNPAFATVHISCCR